MSKLVRLQEKSHGARFWSSGPAGLDEQKSDTSERATSNQAAAS